MADYVLTCDGGSKGNGATDAYAYGSYQIETRNKVVGPYRLTFDAGDTNNVAEYKSLEAGLRHVAHYAPVGATVEIRTDSQLLIGQVSMGWKVKAAHLRPHVDAVKEMIRDLGGNVVFVKVPRAAIEAVLGH